MNLTAMDYVRAALYNAAESGLNFHDVVEASIHAKTPEDFDKAVNMLGLAQKVKNG